MAGCKSILALFSFSLGIILVLLIKVSPAAASLYPTKPIANTTYVAGQSALVSWIEDGTSPNLSSIGRVKIDLYAGNNTFLATVAKDIDPLALSTTIFIPSTIPVHYYLFNLRFKSAFPTHPSSVPSRPLTRPRLHAPGIVVYTADFSITPNPLSVQSVFPLRISTSAKATRTSHSTVSLFSESTLAHPNIMPTLIPTPASRLVPNPTVGTAGKRKSGAVGRGLRGRGVMQGIGVTALMGDASVHIAQEQSSEEMKFQLAFIVWPALIGMSMSLHGYVLGV